MWRLYFLFVLCASISAPAMELEEAKAFCDRWFSALVLGDDKDKLEEKVASLLENFYDDDAVLIDPNFTEPQVGKAKIGNYYRTVMTNYPNWKFTIAKIYPVKEGFVLHYIGHVPGVVERFEGIDILEINAEGKITKLVEGYDRAPFLPKPRP